MPGGISSILRVVGLPHVIARRTQIHILDIGVIIPDVDDFARHLFYVRVALRVWAWNTVDARQRRIKLCVLIDDARRVCVFACKFDTGYDGSSRSRTYEGVVMRTTVSAIVHQFVWVMLVNGQIVHVVTCIAEFHDDK